jgi:DNA-binding response OmpR family regulator
MTGWDNYMQKKRVVIVDDDKDFLGELEEVLIMSGYDLVAVNDPMTALGVAAEVKPDVVLLDLKMPKKTGFELASDLGHFFEGSPVPIIAMSAFYKDDFMPLLNFCGIKRCLKKPFNPLDVISEIENALKEKGA